MNLAPSMLGGVLKMTKAKEYRERDEQALNAELAKAWKTITERKPAPPDADEWKGVEQKLHLLDRGDA